MVCIGRARSAPLSIESVCSGRAARPARIPTASSALSPKTHPALCIQCVFRTAPFAMGERIRVRNSQRLLQFFALALLALGTLNVLIQGGWAGKLVGVASLAAGISGVLGLSLSWHRALMSFTLLSWLVALSAFASLLRLALSRPIQTNPLPWVSWLANLLLALPAAVLASTMHILRVWKPSPMVTGVASAPGHWSAS